MGTAMKMEYLRLKQEVPVVAIIKQHLEMNQPVEPPYTPQNPPALCHEQLEFAMACVPLFAVVEEWAPLGLLGF